MNSSCEKLLSIASPALTQSVEDLSVQFCKVAGEIGLDLWRLLCKKNGFFAFESSLRVFPYESSEQCIGIFEWNLPSLWRNAYGEAAEGKFFFAEDVFGSQFYIANNEILFFDPETGDTKFMGNSLEEWADIILQDFNLWTGYPIGHAWQEQDGKLPNSFRLMPKIPFVCGGPYTIDNLCAVPAVTGMRSRGNLSTQIRNLADGAQIEFTIVD